MRYKYEKQGWEYGLYDMDQSQLDELYNFKVTWENGNKEWVYVDKLSDEEVEYLISNPKEARRYLINGLLEEKLADEPPLKRTELIKVVLFLAELFGIYPSLNKKQLTPTNTDLAQAINEYEYFYSNISWNAKEKRENLSSIKNAVKKFDLISYDLCGTPLYQAILKEINNKGPLWKSVYEKQEEITPTINLDENRETPEYIKWRKDVLDRDRACKCCGVDVNLQAHHLFGYKENPTLQLDENNGVTLCKWCHEKYHSLYGVKGINPIDFIDFIKKFGVKQ